MKKTILYIIFAFFAANLFAQKNININEIAPIFKLDNVKKSTDLLTDNKYIVVIFYRGSWCPVCMKHLSELNDSLSLITDKNASVLVVTPEAPESIETTKEKSKADKLTIIYDKDYSIMKVFGVDYKITKNSVPKFYGFVKKYTRKANKNNDDVLPIPATFIINNENKIVFKQVDKNYKNRASVNEILQYLK